MVGAAHQPDKIIFHDLGLNSIAQYSTARHSALALFCCTSDQVSMLIEIRSLYGGPAKDPSIYILADSEMQHWISYTVVHTE